LGGMGDSGAITTNDSFIAKKIVELSGSRDILNNPEQINSRIDEIQASILRIKLKFLDEYIFKRRKIASLYQDNLIDKVRIVSSINNDFHHLLVIYVPHSRDKLKKYLLQRSIETKIHYPIPLNKIKSNWFNKNQLINANIWSEHILSLPIFIGIKENTIVTICKAINNFYKNN
jgi:dTDP-4-amino-4,6-dideoxygalactose transaminase